MQCSKGVDRVFTPVHIEVKAPFPHRFPFVRGLPEGESSLNVVIHAEEVVRERAHDRIVLTIGIEDLPVPVLLVEADRKGSP
jgi:hypothetical protein